jgi:hypothetical protein
LRGVDTVKNDLRFKAAIINGPPGADVADFKWALAFMDQMPLPYGFYSKNTCGTAASGGILSLESGCSQGEA